MFDFNKLLDRRISKHWPEFGQNGKEDVTVADLMRHEVGFTEILMLYKDFMRHKAMLKKDFYMK